MPLKIEEAIVENMIFVLRDDNGETGIEDNDIRGRIT